MFAAPCSLLHVRCSVFAAPCSLLLARTVEVIQNLFREHVDTAQLLCDLKMASEAPAEWVRDLPTFPGTEGGASKSGAAKRSRGE